MYAIIQAGGRQLKVEPGSVVEVDHLKGNPGDEVRLDNVLVVAKDAGELVAGSPFVAHAQVVGVIDATTRGPKIRVFRKKRRKGMRRARGHRSTFTRIRITEIVA
ncbi:MAG: 50S ribosomal protein L21 [Acidobacteria bacterium]|nr:50S ribosomal protein L21 [Acidobacteriota bacterium]